MTLRLQHYPQHDLASQQPVRGQPFRGTPFTITYTRDEEEAAAWISRHVTAPDMALGIDVE